MITIGDKTKGMIQAKDERLNKAAGYSANDLSRYVGYLMEFGRVEVGWREGRGRTDSTAKVYSEWKKIVKALHKEGIYLMEERVKHANKSPTMAQGYWNSIIYTIDKEKSKAA